MDKRRYYKDPSVAGAYEDTRFATAAGRMTHERELDAARAAFAPGEKLLELACGTGRLLRALRAEGRAVIGVDQSAAMLEAGAPGGLADVHVGDVFALPFPDGAFDGAYCFRFTNHYADLSGFLRECSRVLRPGGRLVFDTMSWSPLLWDSERWGGRNHPVSSGRVRAWLTQAGFAVEEERPLFPIGPYLLGRLPLPLARAALACGALLPAGFSAVTAWRARRL